MYYVIKNNEIVEMGDNINAAWEFPAEAQELPEVTLDYYVSNKDQFVIFEGRLVDISDTDNYRALVKSKAVTARLNEIKFQLQELDTKCIRAIREGGSDDDGIPFIEKYQSEINSLRDELELLK